MGGETILGSRGMSPRRRPVMGRDDGSGAADYGHASRVGMSQRWVEHFFRSVPWAASQASMRKGVSCYQRKMGFRLLFGLAALGVAGLGCSSRVEAPEGPSCEERHELLQRVVTQLPTEGMTASVSVGLPTSTLSGAYGRGPVLEISDRPMTLDGQPIPGGTHDEQLASLRSMLEQRGPGPAAEAAEHSIYLAVASTTDVRTLHSILLALPTDLEIKLLFARPPLPPDPHEQDTSSQGQRLAERVLAERDPSVRHELAAEGYAQFSNCAAVDAAAASVRTLGSEERWPRLRQAMLDAIPKCQCDDLDADALRQLLVAEQRAGAVALGAVTISFLRDERCNASMPLDSMQQLLDEIDEFDAEFSGDWKEDALVFEQVVTDERLLNYLCVALPGETLAALQRKSATVYFRAEGSASCQGWRFEQLSRGAPMGTWRRVNPELPPLAIHYRQGAEEIRLFGPAAAGTTPTDEGPWVCNQDVKMEGIDPHSIQLQGGGTWFLDEAACKAASASSAMSGCIGKLVAGLPVPATPSDASAETDPSAAAGSPPSTAPGSASGVGNEPASAPPASGAPAASVPGSASGSSK